MGKEILTFGDIEIEKKNYHHKILVPLRNINTAKELVSYKIYFGEKNYKYFIGYLYNNHKIKPLHIMLPKTSAYIKSYDGQTKRTYFLIKVGDLLKKYNSICDKSRADIKKEFDSEPVCNF